MARLNCHLGKEIDFHPKIPRKRELVRFPFFYEGKSDCNENSRENERLVRSRGREEERE
jgi:hypothetical protein